MCENVTRACFRKYVYARRSLVLCGPVVTHRFFVYSTGTLCASPLATIPQTLWVSWMTRTYQAGTRREGQHVIEYLWSRVDQLEDWPAGVYLVSMIAARRASRTALACIARLAIRCPVSPLGA